MTAVTLTKYATQTTWPPSGTATAITIYSAKVSTAIQKKFKIEYEKPLTKSKYATAADKRVGDLKLSTHTVTVEGYIEASSVSGAADAGAALQTLISTVDGGGFALLKVESLYTSSDISDSGSDGIWVNFQRFTADELPTDTDIPAKYHITLQMIRARSI